MEFLSVLGDSLSRPRPEENINLTDTYSFLLSNLLGKSVYVINNARRANTTSQQIQESYLINDINSCLSEYYIIQLGIVDCAPRLFSIFQQKLINQIHPVYLKNFIIKFMSKRRYFFTKHFPKVYVKLNNFYFNYSELINYITITQTNLKKIFVINIPKTNEYNLKRSFGFENNIKEYNEIINRIAKEKRQIIELIDLYTISEDEEILLHDGIHINKRGHQIIAENIYNKIQFLINQKD